MALALAPITRGCNLLKSPFRFEHYGESGIEVTTELLTNPGHLVV